RRRRRVRIGRAARHRRTGAASPCDARARVEATCPPESLTLSGGTLATLLEAAQLAARAYCRSNTAVLLTASPFAFFPVLVTVKVLPSEDTTAFTSIVSLPAFFQVPV